MINTLSKIGTIIFIITGFIILPFNIVLGLLFIITGKFLPILTPIIAALPAPIVVALGCALALVVVWLVVKILRDFL